MKLQLALDRLTKEECFLMVEETLPFVDWIEIGTGVIKEYGMDIVREMKLRYPDIVLVADMKTCDAGQFEAQQAFGAGADIMTVMAFSHDKTIEAALSVAAEHNGQIMIDMLQVEGIGRMEELESLGAKLFALHIGKDGQAAGKHIDFQKELQQFTNPKLKFTLAGGITASSIPMLKGKGFDVLIIGSAITASDNPKKAAKEIQNLMK
ncbi:3-hexulose-6-phosphate synthase [Planococcus citreus]|uniref:3-hexulose-6-phosphate synthase n=1 Tax=Planococcus citreus TaxID=1373 RepID=A0A497YEP6_9BACL|nr:3-hexulose-6-phosphate synthase [Planococcus citreus]RLJ86246.1 3-hexulose-6-phosphate synthase [Planococcus citreus]